MKTELEYIIEKIAFVLIIAALIWAFCTLAGIPLAPVLLSAIVIPQAKQEEEDKWRDELIEDGALLCEPNWRLADGSKGWLWFDTAGNKKVTWVRADGYQFRTTVQ